MIDLLYISPERFHCKPQVGVHIVQDWDSFAGYLSRPSVGESKDLAGGYAVGRYEGNVRRKAALVHTGAVVLDFDESAVAGVAGALAKYHAIVHETFSSTDDAPRCRALVLLAEPIDAATYDVVHAVVRAHLRAAGVPPDEGAKDCSRLSYSPVRRAGARYAFVANEGKPLDAAAVLAAQPPEPPRSAPTLPTPEHADAYRRAALRKAADAIAAACPGERHYVVSREAWSLARLGLEEHEIAQALLPAAVASMGERREAEARRTIRDAVRARRGAA